MTAKRIASTFLLMTLSGGLTDAWGAESVQDLIDSGEAVQKEVNSAKNAQDDLAKQNTDLVAQGKQLVAEQKQLPIDRDAWQKESDALQQRVAAYHAKCEGKPLNEGDKRDCKKELDDINTNIANVNTERDTLNKRVTDLNDNGTKYNDAVKQLQTRVPEVGTNYTMAINKETDWLVQALNRTNAASFKPYAAKFGCPAVSKQPGTDEGVMSVSSKVLACLKKFASTSTP
jgi:chromosome segregation ATPase